MRNTPLTLAAFLLAGHSALAAEDAVELARKSESMNAHWTCSVLASQIGRKEEESRHFSAGRRDGEIFYAALLDGRLQRKVYNLHAEISVMAFLDGPNPDFAMGRYFEHIKQTVFDELATEPSETDDGNVTKERAHMRYLSDNCELLQ